MRRGAAGFVLFGSLVAWLVYNSIARGDLSDVISRTYGDIREGNVNAAIERLESFKEVYPYSMAARDAQKWAVQLRAERE